VSANNQPSGDAPVEIVSSDPSWPLRFEEEKGALQRVLAIWLVGPIEHIGSTAVPGLAAKPVIDIMAAVRTLEDSRPAISAVSALGYCYSPFRPDKEHWFCKPSEAFRTHHLHMIPHASVDWIRPLAFRDYLRAHQAVAGEYEELKRRLAERFRFDRAAYTRSKTSFISRITDIALKEGYPAMLTVE
jgi:GrpB-like predicted nucleotidyltransferase (UPF0157 family)